MNIPCTKTHAPTWRGSLRPYHRHNPTGTPGAAPAIKQEAQHTTNPMCCATQAQTEYRQCQTQPLNTSLFAVRASYTGCKQQYKP
jgi:hypothetical protein